METTAARYDGDNELRISGRLKVFCDAAAKSHDTPIHCVDCDFDGCHHRYLGGLAGALEMIYRIKIR